MTRKTSPSPTEKRTENRRGSADAVEKRRAARLFNKVLLGEGRGAAPDGRTERRRRRLLDELAKGKARGGKRELKPIDILSRVQELLALGEPLASIKKACPKPRPVEITDEVIEGIRLIHRAYTFSIEAYAFVGIDAEALRRAGVLPEGGGAAIGLRRTSPPAAPAPGLRSTRPKRRLTRAAARG